MQYKTNMRNSNATLFQKSIFLAIALLTIVLSVQIALTETNRGHYTGDEYSSEAVFIAGWNFVQTGFFRHALVPAQFEWLAPPPKGFVAHNPKGESVLRPEVLQEGRPSYYTHYPPGADLVQGALFELGLDSWRSHQVAALLVGFAGVALAWIALSALFPVGPALAAWMVVCLSPSFLYYADNFREYNWFHVFRWLFVLLVVYTFRQPERWRLRALQVFALSLIASWFSLDLAVAFVATSLAFLFLRKDGVLGWKPVAILVLAAPFGELLGFMLHFFKNTFVLGGVEGAITDFWRIFQKRAALSPDNYDSLKHAAKFVLGLHWFFTLPVVVASGVGWVFRVFAKDTSRGGALWKGLAVATFAGAFTWQFFMRQHSMAHAFTVRHADIFVALGFGLFIQQATKQWARSAALACVALFVAHTAFALGKVEFANLKQSLVSRLVPIDSRAGWGCRQLLRMKNSTDRKVAKAIAAQMAAPDCAAMGSMSQVQATMSERVAELILYWR